MTMQTKPELKASDDAALFQVNPDYERAALILANWREIRVSGKYRGIIPVYLKRKAAAAEALKTGNGRYEVAAQAGSGGSFPGSGAATVWRAVVPPPSEAETEALKASLKAVVERWRKLPKDETVDPGTLRAEFRDACWKGHAEMIAAWTKWLNAIRDAAATDAQRRDLEDLLCITGPRQGGGTPMSWVTPPAPGEPINHQIAIGFPEFQRELADALNRIPAEPIGGGKR